MKKIIYLILLMLLILLCTGIVDAQPYQPGAMLGKRYWEVKQTYEDYYPNYLLMHKSDSSLAYYDWRDDVIAIYTFNKPHRLSSCNRYILILDNLRGEELIGYYHGKWEPFYDLTWIYQEPGYSKPIIVQLTYTDDNRMEFDYSEYDGLLR